MLDLTFPALETRYTRYSQRTFLTSVLSAENKERNHSSRNRKDAATLCHLLCHHTGTQLVEALRYKKEGRGFDSRWFQWNFSLI